MQAIAKGLVDVWPFSGAEAPIWSHRQPELALNRLRQYACSDTKSDDFAITLAEYLCEALEELQLQT